MNRFVKLMLCVMALFLVFALCACGNNTGENNESTAGTTETTEGTVDDGKVTYTVKVVDEAGNPVAGAMVQLCLEACIPALTNAQGVATWNLEEADYKVSFVNMPAGYTAEQTDYYFADGAYELTISLNAAA